MKKPDDPLTALRATGKDLPDALRASILAMGDAAVPSLLALVEDENASPEEWEEVQEVLFG